MYVYWDPLELQASLQQIDAAVQDVLEKGKAREEAYGEKASLIKQKVKLKTAVELKEAEAFMQIQGEGRNQFAYVNDQKWLSRMIRYVMRTACITAKKNVNNLQT